MARGDADRAVELLDGAVDQHAVPPRALVRDVEVIAAGLGLVAGRAVGSDAVAENAFGAVQFAGLSGFCRKLLVDPIAVDQNTHDTAARDMNVAITSA